MRVLIIGGTGLISTAVTRLLLLRGDHVTHFNRGATPLRLPPGMPAPTLIRGDRTDTAALERVVRAEQRFDAVLDMVAFTPEHVRGALRAFTGRAGHYVFCSSVDAYVKPYVRYPVTEEHPVGGLTAYGRDKAAAERVVLDAHGPELPVTVLRPGHTSGEGGQGLDLFGWNSRYLDRIARGLPLIAHGDGTSLWGTVDIEDSARAFVTALGLPRAMGRAYHLAANEVLTWNQIYAATATALGVPTPEIVHIPTALLLRALPTAIRECAENFQFDNVFDNGAARRDLGFSQTIGFVDTMRRVHRWLVANGGLQKAEEMPLYDRIIGAWRSLAEGFAGELARVQAG